MASSMTSQQRMALLEKIEENKSCLFAKFSSKVTNEKKQATWLAIWDWCSENNFPFVKETRDHTYLRDTVWHSNLKRKTTERRDKLLASGAEGGVDQLLSDWEKKVVKIIGKDSPVLEGLGVPESFQTQSPMSRRRHVLVENIETGEILNPDSPQVEQDRSYQENEELDDTAAEQPSTSATPNIPKQQKKRAPKRKQTVKEEKEELELDILRARQVEHSLRVEQLTLENYKLKVELMKLENELGLPNRFPIESNIVYAIQTD